MKKPVIGITPLFDIKLQSSWMYSEYMEAVEHAGGVPVVLPLNSFAADAERLLDVLDGVLLPGGQDVSPLEYGQDISAVCGAIVPQLDQMEIALARAAFNRGTALLGLCRGGQLINVAFGGTLYQDIYSENAVEAPILHNQKGVMPKTHPFHQVSISRDSRLHNCIGQHEIMTNSFHHQAIKNVAPGLRAVARASDGLIEAVETVEKERFLLGVQWHPEFMHKRDENARKLFSSFIQAAAVRCN